MYARSPAAYEALSSFHPLQLPSARTIKLYIHSNVEAAGEVEIRLADEWKKYDARVALRTCSIERAQSSTMQRILVFDEVKVAAKLYLNSLNDALIGHSMTA